jgi:hypothetical protein
MVTATMDKAITPGVFHSGMPADDGHVERKPPVEICAEPLHGGRNPKGEMNNARVA